MDFNISLVSLIDILALCQGLIIGVILMIRYSSQRPSVFAGLFLITYCLELFPTILNDISILDEIPELLFLPFNFYFLSFPLLYLYCFKIIFNSKKTNWFRTLAPGALEFLIFLLLFLMPIEMKKGLYTHPNYQLIYTTYFITGCLFSAYYALKIIQITKKHQNSILNYYSHSEDKLLLWVRSGSVSLLVLLCSFFFFLVIPIKTHELFYFIVSLFNLVIIYYISIKAISQVYSKMENSEGNINKNSITIESVTKYIADSKCFLDAQLTIVDVSKNLDTSPKKLSVLINETHANFNLFINSYRIEAAKKMLMDPHYSNLSIEGVGYEAGFKSKSAFYRAFQEFEDISPGKYIS